MRQKSAVAFGGVSMFVRELMMGGDMKRVGLCLLQTSAVIGS